MKNGQTTEKEKSKQISDFIIRHWGDNRSDVQELLFSALTSTGILRYITYDDSINSKVIELAIVLYQNGKESIVIKYLDKKARNFSHNDNYKLFSINLYQALADLGNAEG